LAGGKPDLVDGGEAVIVKHNSVNHSVGPPASLIF
jgi:hypothetical protein